MPDFPLQFRVRTYQTEHGQFLSVRRGYLLSEFLGLPIVCDAFVDTAAPLSVVPYTLARQLSWHRLATRLTPTAGTGPPALVWQGIPCELGTTTIRWVHLTSGVRSGPLQLLAKFPLRAQASSLERSVVLGLNLFDDNDVELFLSRASGVLAGHCSAP
jgi:hypothetical protein